MTYTETVNFLADHSDYATFCSTIFPTGLITPFSKCSALNANGAFNMESKEMCDEVGDYHVRLGSWNRIFWNEKMRESLQKRFDELNSKTEEFSFELTDTSDWDEEPGERTWDARINFKISKK